MPTPPTPLIGRRRELRALRREILREHTRILTLTGPGGCGKTRLAIALADEVRRHFPDGVRFIDLSPIADPGHVASAIAHTCGIPEPRTGSILESLVKGLRDRHVLLVLDNFEHVLLASSLLSEVLAAAAGVSMLVTSRERLHLRWEQEWAVPMLELPPAHGSQDVVLMSGIPAVALFAERARAVDRSFRITSENARAIAELCTRLDGLPLAIELAAAQAKVLTPPEMLARVGGQLELLTTTDRDVPRRHRSLRAAMDRSYELLDDDERATFRRLAVFSGGFTLEAATEITLSADATLDLVTSLLDKNLVQREPAPGGGMIRCGLLATIRSYASARLVDSGEADGTARRHAAYFVELAERAEPELRGPMQQARFAQLERERDNLRGVLRWSLETGEIDTGLRAAAALGRFWQVRGYLAEGLRWLTALLALPGTPPPTVARARALVQAAALARAFGKSEARRFIEEALAIALELGDDRLSSDAFLERAWQLDQNGEQAAAEAWAARCLELRRRLGDQAYLARALNFAGDVARAAGDDERAAARYTEAIELARGTDEISVGAGLHNLAHLALASGDHGRAGELFLESLIIGDRLGDAGLVAHCVAGLAGAAAVRHDTHRMGRLFGAAEALLEANGWLMDPADRAAFDRSVQVALRVLGDAPFARAVREGRGMTRAEAIALALEDGSVPAPVRSEAQTSGAAALTEREDEVAALVARGLTNAEVAQALVIGERTVETHVERVLRKLDLGSRTELAIWALERRADGTPSAARRAKIRTATDDWRSSPA